LSAFPYECFLSQKFLKIILIKFCVGNIITTNYLVKLCFQSLMSCTTLILYGTQTECYSFCTKKTFLRTPYSHIDLKYTRGTNCHFELKRVSHKKSFNWWSFVICTEKTNQSSRIAKKSGGYPISQSICNMYLTSCFCCKIDILWVVSFLQNRGDMHEPLAILPS